MQLDGKKIFVLASGSFSGSHFVDHCLSLGARIEGINRSKESSKTFLPYLNNKWCKNFKFYQLNLNHNLTEIIDLIQQFKPHFIVDFAGQGMVAQSWSQPEQWFETNVLSKVKLHEALRRCPFLESYLRFSTPEVYGSTEQEITESTALNPSTPYAVSHAAIDMSLMAYYRQYKFPAILTRTTNVYGPGQQLYRIIPRAILSARLHKKLTLDGGGLSVRNFIEISDVARALVALLLKPESRGQIFHIGSAEYTSIKDLVKKIASHTGVPYEKFVQEGEERPGKDHAYMVNSSKIRKWTNWTPQLGLDQGLERVIAWVDAHLHQLDTLNWDYVHRP